MQKLPFRIDRRPEQTDGRADPYYRQQKAQDCLTRCEQLPFPGDDFEPPGFQGECLPGSGPAVNKIRSANGDQVDEERQSDNPRRRATRECDKQVPGDEHNGEEQDEFICQRREAAPDTCVYE